MGIPDLLTDTVANKQPGKPSGNTIQEQAPYEAEFMLHIQIFKEMLGSGGGTRTPDTRIMIFPVFGVLGKV
jgi:hypothetical protein